MELFTNLVLGLHIAAGFTALITGIIAWATKKGSRNHVKSGKFFYACMLIIVLTAVVLATVKFNPFLLLIAAFSFYMSFTGVRSLLLRRMPKPQPQRPDWIGLGLGLAFLVVMAAVQVPEFITSGWSDGIVLVVFSLIFAGMMLTDFRLFRQPQVLSKQQWLARHISRMGGAFIATVTAFVVVNIKMEPAFIPWLLPTVVFTPLIAYHQYKLQKKTSGKAVKAEPVL